MKINKISCSILISSLFEMIVGILLFINPAEFTAGIILVFGILLFLLLVLL